MAAAVLLADAGDRLRATFGARPDRIVLHGSEARGEARAESDLDLLVVLHGEPCYGRDAARIVDALYPLILASGRVIDAQPVAADQFAAAEFALYRSAQREGIRL